MNATEEALGLKTTERTMNRPSQWLIPVTLLLAAVPACAQKVTYLSFGNFDQWLVREIQESSVIGGNTRYLYEIAPHDTIRGNIPYRRGRSPWRTSNVLAKVSGITKGSVTVVPERRGNGYCARLDTKLETVKVLGIINISVLASGSIFLGEMLEPIQDTKNPQAKLNQGVPFTGHPTALLMDYKFHTDGSPNRIKATGFSAQKVVPGADYADVTLMLQKRWEDADGNVYAKRVATANERIGRNTPDWINGHRIAIHYGDITGESYFQSQMGLVPEGQAAWCRNSKGVMVPIHEVGWAGADEQPTHLMLQITSSYGGAYVGTVGNSLWVDNVKLQY